MTASHAKGNTQGALFALLAFAIFSAHDVFIKTLGGSYAPMQILFFSGLLSFPLMTMMLIGDSTKDHVRPAHPWWLALRCLAMLLSATAGFYAVANLPLAQFYAIIFATPLLITVLSIPILGETVRMRRWAAVIVGLGGVMIVLRPGSAELGPGHLAALFCAIGGATNSVVVRKIGRDERAVVLMLYPMLVSFLVLGATLPFVYKPMPIQHLGLMALIAAFSFVAMLCLIRAYRFGEAVIVAPMQYSQILWAILYGALFFGEMLDLATILGASVVIASGLYILFRESRGSSSANKPVLRSRSREATGSSLRVSSMLRRRGYESLDD